jgi:hypothetical protein
MKKSYLAAVITLTCLLGPSLSAHAQEVVTVPFEFVAGAETMPAGTYTVGCVSPDSRTALILRSEDAGVFLMPIAVDEASVEQGKLSFEHVGDKYFLSKVETPAGVYIIETPQAITKLARMKDHGTVSTPGN